MAREAWVQSQAESYQKLKKKKMVLDASLLNTQEYKVHLCVVVIENGAFGSLSTTVANFTYLLLLRNKHFPCPLTRERKRVVC